MKYVNKLATADKKKKEKNDRQCNNLMYGKTHIHPKIR